MALSEKQAWPHTWLRKGLLESTGIGVPCGAVNEPDMAPHLKAPAKEESLLDQQD